jgi:hypothetical protein
VLLNSRIAGKVLCTVSRRPKLVAVAIEIYGNLDTMSLDELVGQLWVVGMRMSRTSRRLRARVESSWYSPRASGRLVHASVEAAGVVVSAAIEVTMPPTTARAPNREGGAATEADASTTARAGT